MANETSRQCLSQLCRVVKTPGWGSGDFGVCCAEFPLPESFFLNSPSVLFRSTCFGALGVLYVDGPVLICRTDKRIVNQNFQKLFQIRQLEK